MKPCSRRLGLYEKALRIAVPAVAACLAALLAHLAIDVAGDYLLTHDAYDAPAHGSRWFASIAALGLACCALWALLRATLAEVRGSYGALRTVLRAALPRNSAAFIVLVIAIAGPTLLGMASLDAVVSGVRIEALGDLLGGSVWLGTGTALSISVATGFAAIRALALLLRFHRSLLRAVEVFVRLVALPRSAGRCAATLAVVLPRVPAALFRAVGANRAPPARLLGTVSA